MGQALKDIDNAQKEKTRAEKNLHNAFEEKILARRNKTKLDKDNSSLETERKMYNEIQPIKNDILHAGREKRNQIIADLKTFASTLE